MASSSSTSSSETGGVALAAPPGEAPAREERAAAVAERAGGSAAGAKGPGGGVPWAFAGAVLILLVVEVALRSVDPRDVVVYDLGEQEHHAISAYVEMLGPADICFVGSSHTREGVLAGEIRKRCERAGFDDIEVANYGMSGARTDAAEGVIRRLLAQPKKPRMILLGLSVRDLRCRVRAWSRLAVFWGLEDWWRNRGEISRNVPPVFPQVVRNEIGRRWRTLAYRDAVRGRLSRWMAGEERTASPVFGEELSEWHQENWSLKKRRFSDRRIMAYLSHNRLDVPGWTKQDRQMELALARLVRDCRKAGVELVLYEMPMSDMLREQLSGGLYEQFLSRVRGVAEKGGVQFITVADLAVDIGEGGFSEYSHLNYRGALKLTKALAEKVVVARLKRGAAGDAQDTEAPDPSTDVE